MSESCSAFSHTLYGTPTCQKYFKDRAGPHSMQRPHGFGPFTDHKTARALYVTGTLVMNPSNDNQMIQIGKRWTALCPSLR